MKKKVLILASPQDTHARVVTEHLEKMDVAVDFLHYEMLAPPAKWNFGFGRSMSARTLITPDNNFNFNLFDSIWFRRPGQLKPGLFPERWINLLVESETINAWNGVLLSTRTLWVNHPRRDADCMHKLWQLHLAEQVGLTVPDTVVTTDPDVVREFFEKCNGKVIYKLIAELSTMQFPPAEGTGISTTPLIEQDLQHIDQVVHCPHIFQRSIEKTADVRVMVFGKKLFAGRIHSQTGQGKLDWRHDYSVKMEPMDMPEPVEKGCLELMRRLKLNYGTMDFCETADGELIFIEINCSGQFLWLEYKTEQPLAQEIGLAFGT